MSRAIRMTDEDNVATVLEDVRAGQEILVKDGKEFGLKVVQDIPFGHKVATADIEKGEMVIKYGEVIARATAHIGKGEHVHIHNAESLRGRGDLTREGSG